MGIKNNISIIIPVYNSENTIIRSLESVLTEVVNYGYDWEIIIVDDGSKDKSSDIIVDYIKEHSLCEKVKLIKQVNKGAAVARNTGIIASTGEYIAFNDADDYWLPGKLKLQMEYLLNNEDVVLLGGIFGGDNVESIRKVQYETDITIRDQVLKNYFSPQAVIFRRKILEKSGLFNEKMRYAEEGFFFNNIVFNGRSVLLNERVTNPILSKERFGDSGLSGNLMKMEKGELFNIRSAYKLGYISLPLFIFAYNFSILKFIRRVIIVKFRSLK